MMQALNLSSNSVKQIVKPELVSEVYNSTQNQKSDKADVKQSNVVDLQKHKNFNLTLEAYSDCV